MQRQKRRLVLISVSAFFAFVIMIWVYRLLQPSDQDLFRAFQEAAQRQDFDAMYTLFGDRWQQRYTQEASRELLRGVFTRFPHRFEYGAVYKMDGGDGSLGRLYYVKPTGSSLKAFPLYVLKKPGERGWHIDATSTFNGFFRIQYGIRKGDELFLKIVASAQKKNPPQPSHS